jgi:hypothetical protein|tara:strand:+ start:3177 stop:3503 length:327 start_codon:yes stop_codon:yes gene_type:complete
MGSGSPVFWFVNGVRLRAGSDNTNAGKHLQILQSDIAALPVMSANGEHSLAGSRTPYLACSKRLHRIFLPLVCAGPLATARRELRQARKGATVAVLLGAGMWLARAFS